MTMISERLKALGFFRELRHGMPDGPSLREEVRRETTAEEPNVVNYLRCGSMLSITGVNARDVLDDRADAIGQLFVATDGVWMWPSDLPYYVAKYHVQLPEEFISHARNRNWMPPQYSDEELSEIWARHARSKKGV